MPAASASPSRSCPACCRPPTRRACAVQDLTGIEVPEYLLTTLADYPHQDARDEFGAVFGSRLIHSVLDAGAPGVHLYTFNRAKPVLDILALMGVTPDPQWSPASHPFTQH